MKHIPHLIVLLLASGAAMSAETEQKVLEPALPPTSLEREENNPAKAAVAAREAQKKDERARADAAAMAPLKPDASTVAANVTRALKESTDLRAGDIAVSTESGVIVLSGQVNTAAEREVAGSIAQRAAADVRVTNRVEVRSLPDRAER